MAKDKNKGNGSKDKIDIRDVDALIELSNAFRSGRYDEDVYMDFLDGVTKKMKKNKKYKEKKSKLKEVEIRVSDTITEFQLSYLRQLAKQIDKDLRIKVYTNF